MERIVNYRQIQLDKLSNVEVHLNSRLSAEQVLEYGAEIVIVATGCHFATDGLNAATHEPIEGADASLDWQLTPDEVVAGVKQIGKRVLVLENEGYFMGASVAQKLAGEGHEVQLVTQAGDIAGYMDYTLEAPMLHRDLHRLGVEIHTYTMLEKIEPGVCHAYNVWDPAHKEQFEVDTVVLCTARISDDELYRELKSDQARLEQEGIEARVRDRRRRGAADDRRLDLRRPPARARDRLAAPRDAAAVHPRAPAVGRHEQRRLPRPAAQHRRCRLAPAAQRTAGRVKIVVPVKQVAALDDEFELLDDGSGVDPDFLECDLNEWDAFSLEAALQLRESTRATARSSWSPSATTRPRRRC